MKVIINSALSKSVAITELYARKEQNKNIISLFLGIFTPRCEKCIHLIKDTNIGKCNKLFVYINKNDPPKCGGIFYKHYLDNT